MMDKILDTRMEQLVEGIGLNEHMKDALTGREDNRYTMWLQYVLLYEMSNPRLILPELPSAVSDDEVSEIYMRCFADADELVNNLG